MVVCCKVWILGVWGELACHERLFNPPPQFSRLGTWCPNFFCTSILLSPVCTWMSAASAPGNPPPSNPAHNPASCGGGGLLLTSLLSFLFYYLYSWLVSYKHTIHIYRQTHTRDNNRYPRCVCAPRVNKL